MACRANKTAALFLIASLTLCEAFSTKRGEQERNRQWLSDDLPLWATFPTCGLLLSLQIKIFLKNVEVPSTDMKSGGEFMSTEKLKSSF